ncbi:MAG: 50S ribosomal protein L13 [Bacteriovoracaceae bacterium]|jgi:large subunit ribosomal protein L13|nr:50S ribosomal protein L13 [Bacteriovoracaceae bacterium]
MYQNKSFTLKPAEADKKWYIIDATGLVVGRLATKVADVLRGKHLPTFTPNTDSGDYVVITNAEKVRFTGNKWDKKIYFRHTNHIGGLKERTAKVQMEKEPTSIVMMAVKGMLPKGSLGRKQLTKLKVFAGSEHSHEAQKPVELTL